LGACRSKQILTFGVLPTLYAIFSVLTLYGVVQPASHERDFVEHLSRTPHIDVDQSQFSVSPIRDWNYQVEGPSSKNWVETSTDFDIEDLQKIWFLVEPHPGMSAMAHTLVLFEFSDERLLGLTIEARREQHESYSAWGGNWGKYELLYVWAEARDLVMRRAIYLANKATPL